MFGNKEFNGFNAETSQVRQGNPKAVEVCEEGSTQLGNVIVTLAAALSAEAVVFVGPLMKIDRYRGRLEYILQDRLGSRRRIEVIISEKQGIEAACMLAISELAMTGAHLAQLAQLTERE